MSAPPSNLCNEDHSHPLVSWAWNQGWVQKKQFVFWKLLVGLGGQSYPSRARGGFNTLMRFEQWIPHCSLNMRGECLKRYSKSIVVLLCLCVRFWCVWGCVWEYVWPVRKELQVTVFSLTLYWQSSRMQVVLPCSKKTEQNWLSGPSLCYEILPWL